MKKITLFISVLYIAIAIIPSFSVAQSSGGDEIFVIVEDMPQYPGGNNALSAFISQNLKYPENARKNKVEGTVYAQFVVEKDGSVSNIRILQSLHPECDAEVLRVLALMPKWTPGKQRGKPVRVQFNLPVSFKL